MRADVADTLRSLFGAGEHGRVVADPRVVSLYARMLHRFRRDILLLLMVLLLPLGLILGLRLARDVWLAGTVPAAAFVLHWASLFAWPAVGFVFLRRKNLALAWAGVVGVNLAAIFAQLWLLRDPGVFVFAPVVAPVALVAPLHVTLLLLVAVDGLFWLSVTRLPMAGSADRLTLLLLFGLSLLTFAALGLVVRRLLHEFAGNTAALEQEARRRVRAEQKMQDARRHAGQIAALTHDVRQPLRAVQGYLAAVREELPDEAVDALVVPAQAATRRAERIFDNLLDLARTATNTRDDDAASQPTDVARLLDGVCADVEGLARYYTDPPVPVRFDVQEPLPELLVDAEGLRRAICNLLDNALVHSPPEGPVTVRARRTGGEIAIAVHDRGPGMPAAVVDALSDPANESMDDEPPLGLGLRQVRALVRAHDGRLHVESGERGTSVQMRFPVEVNHATTDGDSG